PDNPIIVHIAEKEDIHLLAEEVPEIATPLIQRFWPGPLTLILPRSEAVPKAVTAGLETVAVRMPSHPISHLLIKKAEVPVAAPSANLSGRPSPTTAQHVVEDLWGRVDIIIDGGEITHGIESTVLDVTSTPPVLLRPGPISVEELKEVVGEVMVHPVAEARVDEEEAVARSPGMKYRHYAPAAEVVVVEGEISKVVEKIQQLVDLKKINGKKTAVIATAETADLYRADEIRVLGRREDLRSIAKNLFGALRALDAAGVSFIAVEGIEAKGIGLAIMNRLRKAAGGQIITVS
ncbi:MAG: L-threonylcarbamoyladenylate synthase, partial [Candidatus Hadarchaeales archaeon]